MRILITGAFGFIGRHLSIRLLEEPDVELFLLDRAGPASEPTASQTTILQADLRIFEEVRRAIAQTRPEIIYHLAAVGVGDPFLAVEEALNHNLYGTLNLIRTAFSGDDLAQQPRHLIISRTPGEYSAMNPYAASKAAAWEFCRMYARTLGWPIVGAAIFQAYGPGQPLERLLPAAISAALKGQDFPMTAGTQERDWIYAADAAAGLAAMRDAALPPGSTVELGSGRLTSVAAVVEQVYGLVGGPGRPKIGALPTRPGEEHFQLADAARTRELTGWQTAVPLENGLRMTIESIKNSG